MRAYALTAVLVAFVAAVILPNDIGTHELPATGHKSVKAGEHHPSKGKPAVWSIYHPDRSDANTTAPAQLIALRGVQPSAPEQHSPPLLI